MSPASSRPPVLWMLVGALLSCRGVAPRAATPDRSGGVLPTVTAPHAIGAMRWDGRLDEAIWETAGRAQGFVHPATGRPTPGSKVNGDARLAWNDQGLLIAFEVDDRAAQSPFPATLQDAHLWERASGVEVMLQPGDFGDNREYFEVQVGANGARWTTRFDDYNRPVGPDASGVTRFGHEDWEPAIACGTARTPSGYVVEMMIPWASLTTSRVTTRPRPGATWRLNLYTFRDGQRDSLAWSPLLGQGNFHRSARFGQLRFGT